MHERGVVRADVAVLGNYAKEALFQIRTGDLVLTKNAL
jgi:hypothetical protein